VHSLGPDGFIAGRAGAVATPYTAPAVRLLALIHKNMNTVYSNSIVIPTGNTNPINDHDDASKRGFDVYGAYQHALLDEDVS
jgi:hypothetical protein